jgi:deoxyribonucleoside regulator
MKKIVNDERLMIKICDMYYNQNLSQKSIATKLGLSRPTISRIISNARESGIVTITIKNLEMTNYVELEHQVESIYGLKEVVVVDHFDDPEKQKAELGRISANYLKRIVTDRDVVGVSMGTTLYETAKHLEDCSAKNVFFVPMIGGMGHLRGELHSNSLIQIMARKFNGGKFIPMHAPARVANRTIRSEFLNEASIAKVIKMCDSLDIAMVGIGYPNKTSAIMATGYYTDEEMRIMKKAGVAGDICMQFFDSHGDTTPFKKQNTVIGIEIKKLRKVPHSSIGVASGLEKLNAIKGAIEGKYINTLITDVDCAKQLAQND